MISTGRIDLPRRYESLKLMVANFVPTMLNGKISELVVPGTQGYVIADFVKNKAGGVPHGAFGSITLIDGKSDGVLDIPNALIEIEEGAPEGGWHTLANFSATGMSADGHSYAFKTTDSGNTGDTSIVVEFAMADQAGLKGFSEVGAWYQSA